MVRFLHNPRIEGAVVDSISLVHSISIIHESASECENEVERLFAPKFAPSSYRDVIIPGPGQMPLKAPFCILQFQSKASVVIATYSSPSSDIVFFHR